MVNRILDYFLGLLVVYDFFICYAPQDGSEYAVELTRVLTNAGYKCVLDKWAAGPADSLPPALLFRLKTSGVFILIGSEAAVTSPRVRFLTGQAHTLYKSIIPISIDGALEKTQWNEIIGSAVTLESRESFCAGRPSAHVTDRIHASRLFLMGFFVRGEMEVLLRNTPDEHTKIFISYRTDDSGGYALWLYEVLEKKFGSRTVYLDIDKIEYGDRTRENLALALQSCRILTVLIGKHWLEMSEVNGQPRINDPADYVQWELSTGLQRGIRVIPVLVGGARMPQFEDLPDNLSGLASLHPLEIRHRHAKGDVKALIRVLQNALKGSGG